MGGTECDRGPSPEARVTLRCEAVLPVPPRPGVNTDHSLARYNLKCIHNTMGIDPQ